MLTCMQQHGWRRRSEPAFQGLVSQQLGVTCCIRAVFVIKRLRLSRLERLEFCKLQWLPMLWLAVQAFCRTISCISQVASVVKSTRARCAGAGGGSLEAPGTPDPKLNIDGGQQVGDLRFSATERSGAARQNIASLGSISLSPPPFSASCVPKSRGAFAMYHHAKGITTCSLAYSFCDGPSGAQVMPLLLANPHFFNFVT